MKKGTLKLDRVYPDLVIAGVVDIETRKPVFKSTDRDALLAKAGSAIVMPIKPTPSNPATRFFSMPNPRMDPMR